MQSLSDFLNMGGYAFYVWTSYALAGVVLAVNLLAPMRTRRRLMGELKRRARRTRRDDAQA